MVRAALLVLVPLLASCAALGFRPTTGEGSPPSTFIRTVESESEKAVAVVTDPRFEDHEPRTVDPASFRRAMTNSGLFTDEDVEFMGPAIAAEMPAMGPREQVRVLAWAHDGIRRYYFYLRGGALHVVYYRGDLEIDRHRGPVRDGEGVASAAPVTAAPVATTEPSPVETTLEIAPTPVPAASGTPRPPLRFASPAPSPRATPSTSRQLAMMPRLSELQVREKIQELRSLQEQGLISGTEYKRKVKDTLNRL